MKKKESGSIEKGTIFRYKGQAFHSGGAFIGKTRKGIRVGILYAYPKESKVGDWKGRWKVPATFGNEWRSSFGDKRQNVKFKIGKKNFSGIYFKSNSDIVRVKEIKLKKVI